MASEDQKFPPQTQKTQPGKQYLMHPLPISVNPIYKPSDKLLVALVTGGDSGIGRAVCYYFALEGATVAFTYDVKGVEDRDAEDALTLIRKAAKESNASEPIAIPADLQGEEKCKEVVDKVVSHFGGIDVLVNNAGVAYYNENIEDVTEQQLRKTFEINIFAYFFLAKHAVKHMKEGSSIINTASVQAYKGEANRVDYSASKGAIVTFTRSLSLQFIKRGIRVNGVAPGPIWTPIQVANSLPVEKIVTLGSETPMDRAGQPFEVAPSYVFLASNECSSYFTGQVLHPNGGVIVNV
ncbi:glucose and ribitol dehydrogenase-like isoform X1 [Spinacia oleracea]|uniref:Glucose and ribitol dehydrogenase-like isoform X1 n=1 Tax=Spinacia oleracea TaxID=3562 RepID=A0ABM3QYZ1_SPIOL|nr:glucose and ribitol dehydrogenase-like isoform X1 [Spinacia oleracea]